MSRRAIAQAHIDLFKKQLDYYGGAAGRSRDSHVAGNARRHLSTYHKELVMLNKQGEEE